MSNLKAMYKTIVKEDFPETMTITLGDEKLVYRKRQWEIGGEKKGLRYGENPDQPAALYELVDGGITLGGRSWRQPGQGIVSSLTEAQMIQAGKHPGKTNLTDVDNGANILQYLTDKPAALIIKHNNPCGAAWSDKGIADALEKAFWCDRIAAVGGAIVVNRPFTKEAAELVAAHYFEVVAAPSFEDGVVDILKSRKNLRIMELPGLGELEKFLSSAYLDIKCLSDGGLVVQKSFQNRILSADDFIPAEATDIGTGEQDRVGCVELAIYKAYHKYEDILSFRELGLTLYELKAKAGSDKGFADKLADIQARAREAHGGLAGSVIISDGFFPFRDGVDVAMAEGVTAIGQPGGSIRDWEVIQAVNEHSPQVAMVFTGQRSFKH